MDLKEELGLVAKMSMVAYMEKHPGVEAPSLDELADELMALPEEAGIKIPPFLRPLEKEIALGIVKVIIEEIKSIM